MASENVTTTAQRAHTNPQANGHALGDHDLGSENDLDPKDHPKSERCTENGQGELRDSDVNQLPCDDDAIDRASNDVTNMRLEEPRDSKVSNGGGTRLPTNHVTKDSHHITSTSTPSTSHESDCDVTMSAVVDDSDVKGEGGGAEEGQDGGCGWRRRRKRGEVASVGIFGLFRHAGPVEVLMMMAGTLAAVVSGSLQPLSFAVGGEVINTFITSLHSGNGSEGGTCRTSVEEDIRPLVVNYVMLGGVAAGCGYVSVWLWTWSGQRQITRIRRLFFRSVLRQDMAWFDTHPVAQLNSRFSDDMHKIHDGLADKVPVFLQWYSMFLAACVVAFVRSWKLTLVVLAFSPLYALVAAAMAKLLRGMSVKEMKAYATAGAVAEEALRSIRTVQAFQGQEREHSKYEQNLAEARELGTRKGVVLGVGQSLFSLIVYFSFAVSYYYGVLLIQNEGLPPGSIFVVFCSLLFGSLALTNAFPTLDTFSTARAAAVHVFDLITLRPRIDVTSTAGLTLTSLTGVIEFRDVHFRYPSRPDVPVLEGLTLRVQPGQTMGLMGPSGSGKTTVVQLLQRFYDPQHGQISIDGHNVRDLNLRWLRDHLGVVSQEPVLFATTIADNIRYGHADVTHDVIQAAAVEANAHDFISQLPQGYDTMVGERGAQLSGGQKQPIAIARALVKNPRILLLDEATSALDHESEAVVQSALDKARQGRTTIMIAHRLSTIRHADVIVTLSGGRVVEEGGHEELMSQQGMYASFVRAQPRAEEEEVKSSTPTDVTLHEDEEGDVRETTANGALTSRSVSVRSSEKHFRCKDRAGGWQREADSEKETTEAAEGEDRVKEEEEEAPVSLRRLLKVNSPEWSLLCVGTVMVGLSGLTQPAFTFILSEFIRVFSMQEMEEQRRQSLLLSCLLAAVGLTMAVLRMTSSYCFAKAGSTLTARLRSLTFASILRQDMSFFDQPEHQVGSLTTRLASDAALVQGATGSKLGTAMEAVMTVTAALTISFVYGWKLTLVVLAFLPVVMAAGRGQSKVVARSATSASAQIQDVGKICSEAVDNIRTVTSLNAADVFIHKMDSLLNSSSLRGFRTGLVFGVTYGLSASVQYWALSATFAFGAYLVAVGEMEFYNIFRVFGAIVMGGSILGRNSSFQVDFGKGRLAATRLFAVMDRVPRIDIQQTGGKTLTGYEGRVSLQKAVFQYPSRQGVLVLRGLCVSADPGQTVAVVGPSGCGKSTLFQLMLRFYDPSSGAVLLDGQDARDLDLRWLRQQLAVVSQDPVLFDDTITANITYGDIGRRVPMKDVISAARAANIHAFISSLPQGYNTWVGPKGTQLSGGQRQRIAIARALVRQPKVLLLDEATSALDTESERVVQEALDRARQGRTCLVIAHRLATVLSADRIALIQQGRVHETGTHSELMARKGAYYSLLQAQYAARGPSATV